MTYQRLRVAHKYLHQCSAKQFYDNLFGIEDSKRLKPLAVRRGAPSVKYSTDLNQFFFTAKQLNYAGISNLHDLSY